MTVRELVAKYCIVPNGNSMKIINRKQAERDGVVNEIEARKDEIMECLQQMVKEDDEFDAKLEHDRSTIPGLREYDELNAEISYAEFMNKDTAELVRRQQEILSQHPELAERIRQQREELMELLSD